MELKDKVAWVTGGASGLGAATVALLVEKGAKVMATDINEALGREFIAQFGDKAILVRADVADTEDNRASSSRACRAVWQAAFSSF